MNGVLAPLCLLLAGSLLLGGCGGGGGEQPESTASLGPAAARAEPRAPAESADPVVVAALGDSITAGSPSWDPDPGVRAQIGPALDERSQFEYWAQQREPGLRFVNCGVFGERSDEIAARLDRCLRGAGRGGADLLIVGGGINDIAQGASIDAALASLRELVEAGLGAGLQVAIADVLPWNNGHPAADEPIAELNAGIAAIADEEDVPLLPFHDTLENPAEPGTMRPQWTADGDHPSIEGYRLLAERAVLPNLPRQPPLSSASACAPRPTACRP